MPKFIISTDSCVDYLKSNLQRNNIYCIILKHIINGKPMVELFDNVEEYENFYEELSKGTLPTTSQLNSFELQEYFENILAKEKDGDIIHLPLSSALSGTYENAKAAALAVNKKLKNRKIYVIDSLSATMGMTMLVDRLMELRDAGISAKAALKKLEHIRDRQQLWAIIDDLFHLKRGGRLSILKAVVGTVLQIKPILIINDKGALVIENKQKGAKRSIKYVLESMEKYAAGTDFNKATVYLVNSCGCTIVEEFKKALIAKFPEINIKQGLLGPIIGTHVGRGSIAVVFEGAERLKI